jgi:elongation factor 1-gamma
METIVKNPKLVEVYGEFEYVESAPQYVAPKKDAKPKAEKKVEDKPKAEKAPKAPKEKKPVEKDDDDEEPLVPEEPKAKNPLDDLPKSDFNLGASGLGVVGFCGSRLMFLGVCRELETGILELREQ